MAISCTEGGAGRAGVAAMDDMSPPDSACTCSMHMVRCDTSLPDYMILYRSSSFSILNHHDTYES